MSIIDSLPQATAGVLNWLQARSNHKQNQADAAVRAVLVATNATTAYIVDWEKGDRDRNEEKQLGRLWSEAAAAIRRFDQEFAFALERKAQYWTNPDTWSQDDVQRAGIALRTSP
jgi:hypothetical protein